jgi:hypothetical protein
MHSSTIPQKKVNLNDLQPGDILSWVIMGTRHFAIYSPVEGQQGDLIHMIYNSHNECACFKSTISQPLRNLQEGQDITVIRSQNKEEGLAFAQQAEFWLRQGVNYDFSRLTQVLYNNNHGVTSPPREDNILQYLKYAARRETKPVKSSGFPITNINWMTKVGLFFVNTSNLCDPIPRWAMRVVDYSVNVPDHSRGLNCIGLIAAVIAAVKLKDEISAVNEETGWVSIKHTHLTENKLDDTIDRPGLHSVMNKKQLSQFSIERLAEILTPAIAKTSPHLTHSDDFLKNLLDDEDHWLTTTLDKESALKPFDKAAYDAETQQLRQTISRNTETFVSTFGRGIFDKKQDLESRVDLERNASFNK